LETKVKMFSLPPLPAGGFFLHFPVIFFISLAVLSPFLLKNAGKRSIICKYSAGVVGNDDVIEQLLFFTKSVKGCMRQTRFA